MKKLILFIISLTLVFSLPCLSGNNPVLTGFSPLEAKEMALQGAWTGIVTEKNYGPYVMYVEIHCLELNSFCGTIQYPSLKCGGTLKYTGIKNDSYVFLENIQWGKNKCVEGGSVLVSIKDSSSLAWDWYYPGGKKNVSGIVYQVK